MDVELLHEAELVKHLLEQGEHLVRLPLPHVKLRGLQGFLGLAGKHVLHTQTTDIVELYGKYYNNILKRKYFMNRKNICYNYLTLKV